MTYNVDDGEGAQALDYNELADRFDFNVVSGCSVSINSGTLGQSDTLTVASGTETFDGTEVSVSSQSVGIGAADADFPRKDVVYLDSSGVAQVAAGTPEAKEPSSAARFETFRPAPLDLSSTQATVIYEVWVPAGASSIGSSDLRDRRVIATQTGALSDSGSDNAGGGDQYHLPQASDSIDLQSSGEIENAEAVSTGEVNDVLQAEPGELQQKLSEASAHQEVWAVGGAHDPGSETTVPEDVTLRFVGAWFEPSVDYNGFYLEGGAELLNCKANLAPMGSSYTSKVATVDAGRYGTAYRSEDQTEVTVEVEAEQDFDAGTGTALHLRSTSNGSVGVGNTFRVSSRDLNVGLDLEVSGNFIQGGTADVSLKANSTADIRHRGSGPAQFIINGVIQAADRADVGIKNATGTETSVNFIGQWWDVGANQTAALSGNAINAFLHGASTVDMFIGNAVSGAGDGYGTTVETKAAFYYRGVYQAQEDEAYRWKLDNGSLYYEFNGGSGWTTYRRDDLATGDLSINGTLTESANLG